MVLELAVSSKAEAIVTYNRNDFRGAERFGIRIISAREMLIRIGEIR
jgi:predicted nucleic acid-binding protein